MTHLPNRRGKAWKLNPVKAFQFMFIQHCRLSSALHLHLNKEVSIKELLNYLGVSLGQCEKTVKLFCSLTTVVGSLLRLLATFWEMQGESTPNSTCVVLDTA